MPLRTVLLLLPLMLSACASSILINSEPPGARVVVDGHYLGRAPVRYTDTAPVGARHHVELYLEGYEARVATFSRTGPFNVGAACGGVLFLFPFLWIQDYPPYLTVLLDPEAGPGWETPGEPAPGDAWTPEEEEGEAPWIPPPPPPAERDRI